MRQANGSSGVQVSDGGRAVARCLGACLVVFVVLSLLGPTPASADDDLVDTRFDPGLFYGEGSTLSVFAIALQPDGKILIGGSFACVGSRETPCPAPLQRTNLARLHPDGTLDATFDAQLSPFRGSDYGRPRPLPHGSVEHIAVQRDGKILVAGSFATVGGEPRGPLVRLNPDGSLDRSFDAIPYTQYVDEFRVGEVEYDRSASVKAMALQPDGKIVIAGTCGTVRTGERGDVSQRGPLARLNPDGSCDPTFVWPYREFNVDGWHPFQFIKSIAVQEDGKILMAGSFEDGRGALSPGVARVNADGSFDHGFRPDIGRNRAGLVTVQEDGRILLGATAESANGQSRSGIVRLLPDGSLDSTFDASLELRPWGGPVLESIALQEDGRILIGGMFNHVGGEARRTFARLEPDGSLDTSFEVSIESSGMSFATVRAVGLQPDGGILMGGQFYEVNGFERWKLARLSPVATVPAPGVVTSLQARQHLGNITVRWSRPAGSVRSNIFYYETAVGAAPWKSTGASSLAVRGKKGTTLTVRVRAVNEAGPGPIATLRVVVR